MAPGVVLKSDSGDPVDVIIDAQDQGRILTCSGATESTIIQGFTLKLMF